VLTVVGGEIAGGEKVLDIKGGENNGMAKSIQEGKTSAKKKDGIQFEGKMKVE